VNRARHALPVVSDLADPFARRVTYLRVSLTDRCNYRCTYCMPEHGELLPREDILRFEELERVVGVFAGLGVRRVRLTGGEPTVRQGVVEIVERLARVPGIEQVVMTTNGHRLLELAADLARAGLRQLNVSVDSMNPDKFRMITRRGDLDRVLAGIAAARATGRIFPIKINTVALKGWNDGELGPLCDWAWERGLVPRFIEWMPMSSGDLYAPGSLLPAAEIRTTLEAHVGAPLVADAEPAPGAAVPAAGPARYLSVAGDARRRVGIISAMSEHFCDACNRVRLTSVGALHTCLAHDDATDLRSLLRSGASDEDLAAAIAAAVGAKRHGHEFTTDGCGGPKKSMVSIGG